MCLHLEFGVINIAIHITAIITDLSELKYCNNFDFHISLFKSLTQTKAELYFTGRARLIRSHSSARISFELSGNSN